MKMIELFIPRKLVLLVFTAELNHTAPRMVKRGSRFSEVASVFVRLDHGASSIVNAGHDRRERLWCIAYAALLTELGSAQHRRPNGNASLIRSNPLWSLPTDFVNVHPT